MISNDKNIKRPIIMQHCIESHLNNGGPATGVKLLMTSKLSEKYRFVPLMQKKQINNNLFLILDFIKQIRNVKPAIIHIRGLQSPGFFGLLAARLAGCQKVVVSVHGSSIDSLGIGKVKRFIYKNIIEPLTLKNADLVYCVCDYAAKRSYIRKYAKNLYGYIHNAAPDYSILNFESNRKLKRGELKIDAADIVVTYVGRIVYDKGLEDLSHAIKRIRNNQSKRIRYIFVGDGDYMESLKDNLREKMSAGEVLVLGQRSDIRDILIASDIFVFPTLHENLSNALLEACAAGLGIIATNVGGNPEVIKHNVTGLLVDPKDPSGLADSILQLTLNTEFRKNLGKNAKENVRNNFNQDLIFDQIGSVYNLLLTEPR